MKIGNNVINWFVDIQIETVSSMSQAVCSKIKKYEGLILCSTFEINAQKYEVPMVNFGTLEVIQGYVLRENDCVSYFIATS